MSNKRLKEFKPSLLIDQFADSGLDSSIFENIDETQFKQAPNFLTFCLDPEFLNATVLPKQVEIGTKLFSEYCPICSEEGYIDNLYDQDVSTIREKIVFLEKGLCPSCGINRFNLVQRNLLGDYNELACCMGQRCIPKDSWVYTHRGILKMEDVDQGDILSHGYAYKKVDSGKLKRRILETEIGWDLVGSKTSHIVPVYKYDTGDVVDTPIAEIEVGDSVLISIPNLWPSINYKLSGSSKWPLVYDTVNCGFLGIFSRDCVMSKEGYYKYTASDMFDVVEDMLITIFGINPNIKNNELIVNNNEFTKWYYLMSDNGSIIPDGIYRTTEESATAFVNYFLSDSWFSYEGRAILRYLVDHGVDFNRFKLLLLNMKMLTKHVEIENLDMLVSVDVSFPEDDENLCSLMNSGYIPVSVVNIYDDTRVEMMDLVVPDTNIYVADGFVHHNSGKSKLIGLLSNYVLHRMLCIPNPIRTFNQSAGDILGMSFAGLSEEKVEKNLWSAFLGFMDSSPWFQKYHSFLEAKGKEMKTDLFVKRASYIKYNHKKLWIDYYGSKGTALRGDTRFFGSIDEMGWMSSGIESKGNSIGNADSIYTSISNSLSTLRMKRNQVFNEDNYDLPPMLIANISSPSSSKDKMMKQVKASKTNPKILGVQLPTWECNPDYTEDALLKEYASMDSSEFYRDFGASPPLESNPFLTDHEDVDRIATGAVCKLYSFEIEKDKDALGDKFLYAKLKVNLSDSSTPRLISFDLGSTNNAFGMTVFKLDHESKPVLESGLIIKPRNGYKVHLPWVYDNITVPMVNNFNVKYVFFDKWQSLDQVTRLRDLGVEAAVYSLKYKDIDNVRHMVTNRSVVIPQMKTPMKKHLQAWVDDDEYETTDISATLGIQMLTARDAGIRFLKPIQGDDDLFRAFALGVNRLSDFKVIKGMSVSNNKPQGQSGGMGVTVSFGGGSLVGVGSSSSSIGILNSRGGGRRR